MIRLLETVYGPMFVPDTDNGQFAWLDATGASPEHEMIEYVCDMLGELKPGIVIDVGANFGCWSLPLAKHAPRVLAFEPQRCVLQCLRQTLQANAHLPITLFDCALGAEAGYTQFPDISLKDTTNFGGVSAGIPHSEHPEAPFYQVPVHVLDDVVPPDQRVAFMKIDVEGSEMKVLQGAQRLIWRDKPVMVVEADHPLTDTTALGNFIQAMKYNVEIFRDNNFLCLPL